MSFSEEVGARLITAEKKVIKKEATKKEKNEFYLIEDRILKFCTKPRTSSQIIQLFPARPYNILAIVENLKKRGKITEVTNKYVTNIEDREFEPVMVMNASSKKAEEEDVVNVGMCHVCKQDIFLTGEGHDSPEDYLAAGDYDWVCYPDQIKLIESSKWKEFQTRMFVIHDGSGKCSHGTQGKNASSKKADLTFNVKMMSEDAEGGWTIEEWVGDAQALIDFNKKVTENEVDLTSDLLTLKKAGDAVLVGGGASGLFNIIRIFASKKLDNWDNMEIKERVVALKNAHIPKNAVTAELTNEPWGNLPEFIQDSLLSTKKADHLTIHSLQDLDTGILIEDQDNIVEAFKSGLDYNVLYTTEINSDDNVVASSEIKGKVKIGNALYNIKEGCVTHIRALEMKSYLGKKIADASEEEAVQELLNQINEVQQDIDRGFQDMDDLVFMIVQKKHPSANRELVAKTKIFKDTILSYFTKIENLTQRGV